MSNILLIAFHFPPDASSTGRLRTLGFLRHLPAHGWQPIVLAPSAGVYERLDHNGSKQIPPGSTVVRTSAFDSRSRLGWRGKYWAATAVPDRWISWWPSAVLAGLRLVREFDIRAIWSTYPIATTHLVGLALKKWTGLPWVADFRDPLVGSGTSLQQRGQALLERKVLAQADALTFTTPGAKRRYATRFPEAAERMHVIPNGFEDDAIPPATTATSTPRRRKTLVHSGLLYREGRNPEPFFNALALLAQAGDISSSKLEVILRASGHERDYQADIDRLGIAELVKLGEPIGHTEALQEQAWADGLLLFQGPEFNAQIPAKIFEYLRVGRPVLALTDSAGDTAALLRETGGAVVAKIDDAEEIAHALRQLLRDIDLNTAPVADASILAGYTRRAATAQLANLLPK